ncbi:MAG: gliding motility lipoprotein GldH [Bacteroidales bacterium]|nr:gliding motility lipoprotein GldH [Bacteroidales bacterium]MCL2133554.1 gliding motility lipoprotein GldH [Bacteroidales bacterium]
MQRLSYLLSCALCAFLLLSCRNPAAFEEIVTIPNSAWSKEALVQISIPAPPDSITDYYRLIINLRNTEDYAYRNIFFFITATAPDGACLRDTIEYELAGERGKWLGKTGRYWIDHRLLYRSRVRFPQQGDYSFSIQHGMRADTLQGIGAIGLRLEKMKE